MGEKNRVIDFAAAVIVLVMKLTLDRYEGAKTHAAFPAPVTCKHCHFLREYCPDGKKGLRNLILHRGSESPYYDGTPKDKNKNFLIFLKTINIENPYNYPEEYDQKREQ